ncbi:MAG: tyrosine-type recombinase/integrase [Treponema sp.]|nr:tyrosine-type recombinase/integrase [Treponema sp.]
MRYSEPYTLYKRKMRDGRSVYYYRPRDPDTGERLTAKSTGKVTLRDAIAYCETLLRCGTLLQGGEKKKVPTLAQWADEYKWWQWSDEGPLCRYCQNELKRSSADAPKIQRRSADECRAVLKNWLLPAHGKKLLDKITPSDLEALMAQWSADGKSPKTINNRASVYRVMLKEACRIKLIKETPFDSVKPYYIKEKRKGCLTKEEYKALMSPQNYGQVWGAALVAYAASLVASVTGLRLSEILALKVEDFHEDYITISGAWNYRYGMGLQKTKRGTDNIPIPKNVYFFIHQFASKGFVFSLDGERPASEKYCQNKLCLALDKIGVGKEERERRRISFHSWRVFCNTYFRDAGVPDSKIREVTRHETAEMTEHYTSFNLDSYKEVIQAQDSLLGGLGSLQSLTS